MKQDNNKENDLQDELESLYQKVARNDHNDEAPGETEDISQCYAILQVSQDAPQAEIAESYEKLKDTWREDRFINVDAWQEKSRKKLQEVKDAYEKILLWRLYESGHASRQSPTYDSGNAFISEELEDIREEIDTRPVTRDKRSNNRLMSWLAGIVAIMLATIGGLFVWPTIYHYESVKAGEKVFPLRINRITSMTTYFDGREWVKPPIPVETSSKTPTPAATKGVTPEKTKEPQSTSHPIEALTKTPAPSATEGSRSKEAREGQTASALVDTAQSALPSLKTEKTARRDPEPQKAVSTEETLKLRRSAPAAPSARKRPLAVAAASTPAKEEKAMSFSIQIKAFREESKARDFLQEMRAYKGKARLERSIHQDKTTWYRILLGHFKSRDQALNYLKKEKIADAYPGSFVQGMGTAS